MRISDWSSDVCSSDLHAGTARARRGGSLPWVRSQGFGTNRRALGLSRVTSTSRSLAMAKDSNGARELIEPRKGDKRYQRRNDDEIGRASCRERVWQYV